MLIRQIVLSGFLVVAACTAGGCAAAGFAADAVTGDPKVPAAFVPTTRPMAVVVESYRSKGTLMPINDSITSLLTHELSEHKVAEMVEPAKVYDLRLRNPKAYKTMKVDEIARAVGAEQVLYVDVLRSDAQATAGGLMIKGSLNAMVRIVDAKTGRTLFPADFDDGAQINVETKYSQADKQNTVDALQESIARELADQIAKLFYAHPKEDE